MDRRRAYPRVSGRRNRQQPPPSEPQKSNVAIYAALGVATTAVIGLALFAYLQYKRLRAKDEEIPSPMVQLDRSESLSKTPGQPLSGEKTSSILIAPPQASKPVNAEELKWWTDIANEQLAFRDFKNAKFYAMKAINEMKNDEKYQVSLTMAEMLYILASVSHNEEEREKTILE